MLDVDLMQGGISEVQIYGDSKERPTWNDNGEYYRSRTWHGYKAHRRVN